MADLSQELRHTPGPWVADPDDEPGMEWNIHIVQEGDRDLRICFMTSNGPVEANARLIAAAPDLLEAAQAQETAELNRDMECDECGGEGEPEACGKCFPAFDDARIKRRIAVAKAIGTHT